jgi:hypothetical protein
MIRQIPFCKLQESRLNRHESKYCKSRNYYIVLNISINEICRQLFSPLEDQNTTIPNLL